MPGTPESKKNSIIVTTFGFLEKIGLDSKDWEFYSFIDFESIIAGNNSPFKSKRTHVILAITMNFLLSNKEKILNWVFQLTEFKFSLLLFGNPVNSDILSDFPEEILEAVIPLDSPGCSVEKIVSSIEARQRLKNDIMQLELSLGKKQDELQKILHVGKMLSQEKDLDVLIDLILKYSISLTNADGGSLYLTEKITDRKKVTHLRFKKSSLNLSADEFLLEINDESIAGYVALTGEILMIENVYQLPENTAYSFNDEFDKVHNYHTKSMMVVPMKNHRNDITGVIQMVNRKRNPNQILTPEQMKTDLVIPFSRESLDLVGALAGQAAVAIENNLLINDIHKLFEGFVRASVKAIEQRDPTTRGHSDRVALYTVETAKAISECSQPHFRDVEFSRNQIREIRYAALLHDFGKVGVREKVLTKSKKLYDYELNNIEWKFRYYAKRMEAEFYKKAYLLKKRKGSNYQKVLQEEKNKFLEEKKKIKRMLHAIYSVNEPTVMEEGDFDFLQSISKIKVPINGNLIPLLTENEALRLSVRKGSLDEEERLEIESHVTHSFNFLIQIPWTRDLENVPEIAYGHHEKLDGTGYPRQLTAKDIPIQAKIMAIADIYDALTATDRPYKKSISREKSLDILTEEAQKNHIDRNILDVFIQKEIYKLSYSASHS